jgi:prepilin-type N-terminal cleavage/methylation domain-containing protein
MNMPRQRTAESGFTLVELMLAITLMGILFIFVFSGLAVFLKTTVVQRSTADLDQTTRRYAENLAGVAYQPCASDTAYVGSGAGQVPVPAGYTITLTVKDWDGLNPAGWGACPPDKGLQQITVDVTQNVTAQKQRLVVAKRQTS